MKIIITILSVFACLTVLTTAQAESQESMLESIKGSAQQTLLPKSPAAGNSYVYIISPQHGEIVHSPVLVKFGLRGMGIAPAGVDQKHTGHHHLLIDVENLPDLDKPIPADDQHKHFGKGQTEALIELSPGTHTLQLLLGDYIHLPHDNAVFSEPITITVVE